MQNLHYLEKPFIEVTVGNFNETLNIVNILKACVPDWLTYPKIQKIHYIFVNN